MFNVSKVLTKLFPCKKIKNRAVIPQVTVSKEDLQLDVLVTFESILKAKKIEALTSLANLIEHKDLYNDEPAEQEFRDVTNSIGLDFDMYDVDYIAGFCAGVEWSEFLDDIYVKNYDVAFNKLIYIYEQFRQDNYTFFPDVECEEDLIDILSSRILRQYVIPEYLEGYIDWDSFVKDYVADNNGIFAQYGYFAIGEADF